MTRISWGCSMLPCSSTTPFASSAPSVPHLLWTSVCSSRTCSLVQALRVNLSQLVVRIARAPHAFASLTASSCMGEVLPPFFSSSFSTACAIFSFRSGIRFLASSSASPSSSTDPSTPATSRASSWYSRTFAGACFDAPAPRRIRSRPSWADWMSLAGTSIASPRFFASHSSSAPVSTASLRPPIRTSVSVRPRRRVVLHGSWALLPAVSVSTSVLVHAPSVSGGITSLPPVVHSFAHSAAALARRASRICPQAAPSLLGRMRPLAQIASQSSRFVPSSSQATAARSFSCTFPACSCLRTSSADGLVLSDLPPKPAHVFSAQRPNLCCARASCRFVSGVSIRSLPSRFSLSSGFPFPSVAAAPWESPRCALS